MKLKVKKEWSKNGVWYLVDHLGYKTKVPLGILYTPDKDNEEEGPQIKIISIYIFKLMIIFIWTEKPKNKHKIG